MTKKVFKPKSISQPYAKTKFSQADTKALKSCSYSGGYWPKKYRQWTDIKNILKGKRAQCGSTEGSKYGGEVQHIGSPTGDFPRPALLRFYNFDKSMLNENTKVKSIKVTFDYRVVNVTKSGKIWTKNLGKSERAVIQGVSAWFGNTTKKTLFGKVQKKNTKLQYEYKDKKGKYKWKTITFTFKDITINHIFNSAFAFNLAFGHNCSKASTPCFLYIDNFKMTIDYDGATKYIEGKNNINNLYTSSESQCRSTITQTIEAGYKNGSEKISVASAPETLGDKITLKSAPANVTVTNTTTTDLQKTFTITDKSNIEGTKTITYYLNNDKTKEVSLQYQAIKRPKPEFYIREKYKFNEDFDTNKSYIIFKNGCASSIKIYTDGIETTPLSLTVANQNSSTNLLNRTQIQKFHNHVKQLSCGYHTLYIQRGDESIEDVQSNAVVIKVSPMQYKFNIFSDNNPNLIFQQSKDNQNRYETIKIQRVDTEPIATIPELTIVDETSLDSPQNTITNITKGSIIEYEIDKYYAGRFQIQIADYSSDCPAIKPSKGYITIESSHKQNYDYVFTRAEDGTAIDIEYLVAWEGDNIKSPITLNSIEFNHGFEEIKICSEAAESGLSQIGTAKLRVRNTTANKTFKDIKIELNTLIKNNNKFDVTTEEWTGPDGIFNDFYNLFYEFNQELANSVTVENLTKDNDFIDEENVYLNIKQIDPGDSILINIPFKSSIEKTIYLQFLLFEEACPIYSLEDCNSLIAESTDYIEINVIDSMQTQLEIEGNMDLLVLDTNISCPDECYTTENSGNSESEGITYKITNIDTNDFIGNSVKTQIINSNELQPYGYYIKNEYYALFDENGERITNIHDNPLVDQKGNIIYDTTDPSNPTIIYQENKINWEQKEQIYNKVLNQQLIYCYAQFPKQNQEVFIKRTNSQGLANFFITIPNTLKRSYTIEELLNEVVYFKYKGKRGYDQTVLSGQSNPYKEQIVQDLNKSQTILSYNNNYKRYYPGEVAHIPVFLSVNLKNIINQITFNADLQNIGSSDEVTILYKICNIENNQGKFKTTFKTNDKLLIPNEISKNVYCGINTNIDIDTKLEKQILESETINVIYINVNNKDKLNKDVSIEMHLKQHPIGFEGDYNFLDINIDSGDYAIQEEDGDIIVTWLIGEMQEYQVNKGIIKIKADNIGLSNIQINAFDYLHQKNQVTPIITTSSCNQCKEKNTYRVKDSAWKKISGVWYKKINGVYYKKVVKNGKVTWVKK